MPISEASQSPALPSLWIQLDWLLAITGAGRRKPPIGSARTLKLRRYAAGVTQGLSTPTGCADVGPGFIACVRIVLSEAGISIPDAGAPEAISVAARSELVAAHPSKLARRRWLERLVAERISSRDEVFDEQGCARQLARLAAAS